MTLLSTSIALDAPQVVEPLREAKHLMEEDGGTWTGTERLVARHHVDALEKWCQSDMYGAAESWEEVLLLDPLDTMALKFAHDAYFYLVCVFPFPPSSNLATLCVSHVLEVFSDPHRCG